MKSVSFVAGLLLLFVAMVSADETGGKVGIGLKGGLDHYFGDYTNSMWASYGDVALTWWITDQVGANFTYGRGFLSADQSRKKYFKTWEYNYTLMLRIKPITSLPFNPYFAVGYEWFDIDPKKHNGWRVHEFNDGLVSGEFKKINSAVPVGIGFSYFLNEWISLDLESILHISFIDYIDGHKAGTKSDHWASVALGLSFYLSENRDTDHDGIPDKIDKDKLHPEDFDGFQDADGAPDYDNDQDGIPDKIDKAPNEPEDKDGFQDADGVPDLDNDNDGIPDAKDKAPNQAEDKDGFQDDDGIPDPDNDGDGIPDVNDKCPDKAETINGYEDDDGCPDKKPEIAVEKGKSIVLNGVIFATGSAKITPNAALILDKVVKTLKENPEIKVEIRGYTDNTGSYTANMRLSQKRADAVRQYLINHGIAPERVTAKGFGPQNPIAPNNTKEGRSKNRRIEFYRIQ